MSHSVPNPAVERPGTAMHWLCCALVLLIGMTRQLVICTHHDGGSHLEFAHADGAAGHHHGHHHGNHWGGCDHVHLVFEQHADDHGHDHDHGHGHGPDLGGDDTDDPDGSSDHVHLNVEVGPKPLADAGKLPTPHGVALWLPPEVAQWLVQATHAAQPPPATDPPDPRPRQYLALRASTVLLI